MLRPNEVHVWWVATDADAGDGDQLEWMLSPRERLRRNRLANGDRRDYAAAHALLRTTLSMYGTLAPEAWAFDENIYGKPYVLQRPEEPHLEFNLSHTRGLVACAVALGMSVGIDVEFIDQISGYAYLYDRCLSLSERLELESCELEMQRARFAELWTLKEALFKTVGVGLRLEPAEFSFELTGDHAVLVPPEEFARGPFYFALFEPTARHRMALAVECGTTQLVRVCARAADDGREIVARCTTPRPLGGSPSVLPQPSRFT
jgi:4'-phosphopantetheinyl transferase